MQLTKTYCLLIMIILTSCIFFVENIVGQITNSVILIADSYHLLSDVLALVVGVVCIRIANWPSHRNTFGWIRAGVLGALVNAVLLVAFSCSILVTSIQRLLVLKEIENPKLILTVGVIGICIHLVGLVLFYERSDGEKFKQVPHPAADTDELLNVTALSSSASSISLSSSSMSKPVSVESDLYHSVGGYSSKINWDKIREKEQHMLPTRSHCYNKSIDTALDHGHKIKIKESGPKFASGGHLNIKGGLLHILSDIVGSMIIIVNALVVWFVKTDLRFYLDPILSIILVMVILITTIPLFKESAFILLQAVPSHIHTEQIRRQLEKLEGIRYIHEFHVWQLAGNRIVATAHVAFLDVYEYMILASNIKHLFHQEGIHSTTIQPEFIHYQIDEKEQDRETCTDICWSKTCCNEDKCCSRDKVQNNELDTNSSISSEEISERDV